MFIYTTLGFLFFCLCFNVYSRNYLEKQAKWYFLHVICNLLVVFITFNDLKLCLTKPIEAFNSSNFDSSGLAITTGLHLFHIVRDYKILTLIDWLHHLFSNFFMAFIGVYYYQNQVFNCGLFFMCGLPGGIDYMLLFLCKIGRIEKITEKKINVILNNWIRLPGILYTSYVMHFGYTLKLVNLHYILYYIGQIFTLLNGIYFAQRVTLNYGSYLKNTY